MIYKGIEFSIVQDIEAVIWKWSVLIGDSEKIGQTKTKPDAVIAVWRTIDLALRQRKRSLTIPGCGLDVEVTGEHHKH